MRAEKMILETDQKGHLQNVPPLPANTRIEAIFLISDQQNPLKAKQTPSPQISGKGKIIGDILSPVVPVEDWEAAQ